MSDFFDNLVTRSFQPAAAIQPLAASRFVPVPELMDTPRSLAFAAAPSGEPFEDPFAPPVVDEPLAEETEPTASHPARSPRRGRQTASPVGPVEEERQPPPFTGVPTPEPIRPRTAAALRSAEPAIKQVTPPASPPVSEDTNQRPAAAPKSARIAAATGAEPLQVETLRPLTNRHAAQAVFEGELIRPAVQPPPAMPPLAAPAAESQSPPAARRENGIAPNQNLSPRPRETSVAARDRLPAQRPGVERVIVEQVTEVVETADAEARMTLIPKPIAKPPLATNLNVRPKPQPQTQSPAPAPAPPETIVNVTIGRIEIRATPPLRTSAKPERQRNPAPLMGLDEYQRQRNGGSR